MLLCPAREALFTEDGRAAAREAIREAAERVNRPTTKVREVLDAVDAAAPFFGMETLLPGFHRGGLGTLLDYLPEGALVYVDGVAEVSRALQDLSAELAREHAAALGREELALPPEAHFLPAAEAEAALARHPRVLRHGVWMGTGEPIRFAWPATTGLRSEIEGAHGDEGALAPLARRLDDWRSRGIASVIACATPSAADRLRRLLEDRRLACRSHAGPFGDGRALFEPGIHAHLFQGEVSQGFVDAAGGLALLSDEEIFGQRVKKRPRAARAENVFAAAFRDLNDGDLVVHVEHGIARYQGLAKMQIRGVEGDFLVLQYEGADRLYLPVSKLRQVQKFSGAAPEHVRLDRLGGTSFALRKARVKEQLLKMAAELLGLYAARAAHPGFPFPPPDGIFREFEAEFPWEPTPDQARAVEDVIADMTKSGRAARAQGEPDEARPERAGAQLEVRWTGSSAATSATARPRWPCAPPCSRCWRRSRWRCSSPRPSSRPSTSGRSASASRATRCASRPSRA